MLVGILWAVISPTVALAYAAACMAAALIATHLMWKPDRIDATAAINHP